MEPAAQYRSESSPRRMRLLLPVIVAGLLGLAGARPAPHFEVVPSQQDARLVYADMPTNSHIIFDDEPDPNRAGASQNAVIIDEAFGDGSDMGPLADTLFCISEKTSDEFVSRCANGEAFEAGPRAALSEVDSLTHGNVVGQLFNKENAATKTLIVVGAEKIVGNSTEKYIGPHHVEDAFSLINKMTEAPDVIIMSLSVNTGPFNKLCNDQFKPVYEQIEKAAERSMIFLPTNNSKKSNGISPFSCYVQPNVTNPHADTIVSVTASNYEETKIHDDANACWLVDMVGNGTVMLKNEETGKVEKIIGTSNAVPRVAGQALGIMEEYQLTPSQTAWVIHASGIPIPDNRTEPATTYPLFSLANAEALAGVIADPVAVRYLPIVNATR